MKPEQSKPQKTYANRTKEIFDEIRNEYFKDGVATLDANTFKLLECYAAGLSTLADQGLETKKLYLDLVKRSYTQPANAS